MLRIPLVLCMLALLGVHGQQNPLTECHYMMQTYHLMFEGTISNVRERVGEYVHDVSGALVNIMVEEIHRWEQLTRRCSSQRNTEAIGEVVRQCAYTKAIQLFEMQSNIHNVLDTIQVLSNEVSLMPVTQLQDINILREHDTIAERCHSFVLEHYNELEDVHIVQLYDHIEVLLSARQTFPQELTTCVNGAMLKHFPNVHSC